MNYLWYTSTPKMYKSFKPILQNMVSSKSILILIIINVLAPTEHSI